MLIAEDLLLLLTDDQSGRRRSGSYGDYALAGAVLVELVLIGRVRLTEKGESVARANRVVITSTDPTDDGLLDEYLGRLARKDGCRPARAIEILRKDLRKSLYARLSRNGILNEEEGAFWTKRYPANDPQHETEIRGELFRVLGQGGEPDARMAALIGTLSALNLAHKVVAEDISTVDKQAIKKRAKQLRQENWASEAAYKAIQAAQAAGASAAAGGGT